MLDIIKKFLKIPVNVAKAEIEEVKTLVITDEDRKQGEQLALVVYSACAVYGIPLPDAVKDIIAKAGAYVVRDAKEGAKAPEKLIISRVVDEFKDLNIRKYHRKYQ